MLQKLENRAARIVTDSSYDSSASALIQTLNWLTDMIQVETACMVHRSINDLAPDSSSFICLFMNEGWPLSGTFSISLCFLQFLLVS